MVKERIPKFIERSRTYHLGYHVVNGMKVPLVWLVSKLARKLETTDSQFVKEAVIDYVEKQEEKLKMIENILGSDQL